MTKDMFTIFLRAGHNTFATMLRAPLTFGEPSEESSTGAEFDVSGIIGLTGDLTGSVVISMSWKTAKNCVRAFTGVENVPEEDVCDAIGELANMIAGSAKSSLEGKSVSISCPSVVRGKDLQASRPKSTPCVRIPCMSDLGEFELLLAIQPAKAGAPAA
jgi:chemotaxis protein CheX